MENGIQPVNCQPATQLQNGEVEENMATRQTTNRSLTCPDCGKTGFQTAAGLGSHRRSEHGKMGTSKSSIREREQRAQFRMTQKKRGRPHGKKTNTSTVVAPSVPQSLLGYAIGRLQSLAEQIAHENGLPEKQFVYDVALGFAAMVRL